MKKKAAFYTLGCKVNFCETESLKALLVKSGYRITDFEDEADLYIINTCTVTGYSDHKSRKAIRRARRRSPEALLVVTGCYAQAEPEKVAEMEEVDLVIGTRDRTNLPELISSIKGDEKGKNLVIPHDGKERFELMPIMGKRGRTRGFIKIQEGCDQHCTYCIVPSVRGKPRSMPPEAVLDRAETLVRAGCKELVLTGIHLGLYGLDSADYDDLTLASLLRELQKLPGLLRLRLSSLEPSDITAELVDVVAHSSIICPHLHMPLQSGDGEILRLMNRPYNASEFLYLAKWLKQQVPGLSLSSDVIVGFPGESERHHRRSLSLIKDIGFSRLHVFKYSLRPGTAAAKMPGQLPNAVKDKRSREMIALGDKMAAQYRSQFIGTVHPVLVEKVEPYHFGEGFTPHYMRVRIKMDIKGRHWRNQIVRARIEGEENGILTARKA